MKLIEEIRKRAGAMGIKNRTLQQVSVAITILVLVFVILFVLIFDRRTKEDNIASTANVLQNISVHLESYFEEVDSIANEANYDYYLQNYLISMVESEDVNNYLALGKNMTYYHMSTKLFSSYLNSRTDVSTIMVFGNNNLLLHKSIYDYWAYITDYSELDWYAGALENTREAVLTGPQHHSFILGNTEKTITLSRVISNCNDGSLLGVMLIDLNLNGVAKICRASYLNEQGNLYLINRNGELVYSVPNEQEYAFDLEGEGGLEAVNASIAQVGEGDFLLYQNGVEYQGVVTRCDKPGWNIVSVTPTLLVTRQMYNTLGIFIAIMVLITLLILLLLNRMLGRIVQPITELTRQMDIIEGDSLDERVQIARQDETGKLATSFNRMLERIQHLMARIVDEQQEKRKFELQALHAQINPHFLYNTLDSIVWMAELKDANVVPMTEALAKLFRISLSKGNEIIPLQDELEHLRNYLFIQSMRYADKFSYTIELKADVKDCRVPKLMVQPIVENSIYHGIKNKKGKGHITVVAFAEEGLLVIKISDDGNGMDKKTCRDILTKDNRFENTSGSGIGVKNVNERIKLYYGDSFGLEYTSVLGEGTVAVIRLPFALDEAEQQAKVPLLEGAPPATKEAEDEKQGKE